MIGLPQGGRKFLGGSELNWSDGHCLQDGHSMESPEKQEDRRVIPAALSETCDVSGLLHRFQRPLDRDRVAGAIPEMLVRRLHHLCEIHRGVR